MFARVTMASGTPAQVEEATRVLRESVLPSARELPGFSGVLSLLDRQSGKSISVTLWESEQAMRDSEEAANRLRDEAMQAAGAVTPTVERYEVVIDERS
jgi:heme-degrading monooxygenase HmoA